MKKRISMILISLVLTICLIPVSTFAADVTTVYADEDTHDFMFKDVTADDYFFNPVLWSASYGITTGTDPIHFSPHVQCTRAQMVTFLWRAAGSPKVLDEISFTDVHDDAYYADAIAWAIYEDISNGTGKNKFEPDADITREQLATFIYRYAMLEADNGYSPNKYSITKYEDRIDINDWAMDGMKWCVQLGIINGVDDTTLAPQKTATRAEIVTMLYRFYNR